jgi:hypothetical protein
MTSTQPVTKQHRVFIPWDFGSEYEGAQPEELRTYGAFEH